MSQKLKVLLEKANEKLTQKEDGTLADLGPAPTGHIIDKQDEEATDND